MAIRLVLAVIGAVLSPLAVVASASAHAEVESIAPSDGSHVQRLPGELVIRTGEGVRSAQLVVTRPDARVDQLSVSVSGQEIVASLPSTGPRGEYAVAYRIVAADGHVTTGTTNFSVDQGAEPDFAAVSDDPAPTGIPVIGLAVGAVVLLVVGVMLVVAKGRR